MKWNIFFFSAFLTRTIGKEMNLLSVSIQLYMYFFTCKVLPSMVCTHHRLGNYSLFSNCRQNICFHLCTSIIKTSYISHYFMFCAFFPIYFTIFLNFVILILLLSFCPYLAYFIFDANELIVKSQHLYTENERNKKKKKQTNK